LFSHFPGALTGVISAGSSYGIPEAIVEGHAEGCVSNPRAIDGQFLKFGYAAPGHAPNKMYCKYGGSHLGTMVDTNRYARMYASENLEFVANQSIWLEGEAKFADVILPACTNFERWDIGEFANAGGMLNTRIRNVTTPSRMMIGRSHAMAANSCLIQVERWDPAKVSAAERAR
jgi:anaerobic selenocysteine-containing dehydrogenase